MNIEQLIKLIDAGFTRDDILTAKLLVSDTPKQPVEEPENTRNEVSSNQEQVPSLEDRVAEVVKNTMSQYAKANIMTANQPKQDTVDDILAQILTPSNIR